MEHQSDNSSFWNEKWKRIVFDGIDESEKYDISNFGRIRRFNKTSEEWKVLKSSYIKGYKVFAFRSGTPEKKTITKTVHKLVAEAFCERPSEQHKFVIHLDFVKDNNHHQNLKWVTHQEMYAHHRDNPNYKKGVVRNSKLTETEVIRLKKKVNRGKNKLYKIAREFGITHTQLNRIRSGENWSHIKVEDEQD
ncbi:MAG: NUMOD4 domain-containing protein [Bacteroidota bacterium]